MYSDVCGCRLVGGDSGGRGGECTVTVAGGEENVTDVGW